MLEKTDPHAPQLQRIRVDRLCPDPRWIRRRLSGEHDQELQESLRTEGQKLALLVRLAKDGRYVITDGHRRWKAMLALEWREALCIVAESISDDKGALHTQLVIALQHEHHHNRDVAAAVKMLQAEFGMKVDEIAAQLSKGRAWIYRLLQLCDLPEEVRALEVAGKVRDVDTLLTLDRLYRSAPERAASLIAEATEKGLPRHRLRAVRDVLKGKGTVPPDQAMVKNPAAKGANTAVHTAPSSPPIPFTANLPVGPEPPRMGPAETSAPTKHAGAQPSITVEKRKRVIRSLSVPETITNEELLALLIDWFLNTSAPSENESQPQDAFGNGLH